MVSFKGAHFVKDIILTYVRWYVAKLVATSLTLVRNEAGSPIRLPIPPQPHGCLVRMLPLSHEAA
jgi:hypothetical protein